MAAGPRFRAVLWQRKSPTTPEHGVLEPALTLDLRTGFDAIKPPVVRDDGRMPIERLTEFSQLSVGEQKRGAGRPHGSSNTLSDKLHAIATL
jgi:hypothetical protein